jgi:hypothetical protein
MSDQDRERFLNDVLDSALSRYAGEPRRGLENRALARLAAERTRKSWLQRVFETRWPMPMWAGAGALATAAVVIVALNLARTPANVPATVASVQPTTAAPVTTPHRPQWPTGDLPPRQHNEVKSGPVRLQTGYVSRRTSQNAAQPSRVFPAAAPLSKQELLLVRLAVSGDPEVLQALADASKPGIQPVEIKPIEIPPLAGTPQ